MPRFHVDIYDGKDFPDDIGLECRDPEEARQQAVRATGKMLRDRVGRWKGNTLTMTVMDERRAMVALLEFSAK